MRKKSTNSKIILEALPPASHGARKGTSKSNRKGQELEEDDDLDSSLASSDTASSLQSTPLNKLPPLPPLSHHNSTPPISQEKPATVVKKKQVLQHLNTAISKGNLSVPVKSRLNLQSTHNVSHPPADLSEVESISKSNLSSGPPKGRNIHVAHTQERLDNLAEGIEPDTPERRFEIVESSQKAIVKQFTEPKAEVVQRDVYVSIEGKKRNLYFSILIT
jgi:hypothetical protein